MTFLGLPVGLTKDFLKIILLLLLLLLLRLRYYLERGAIAIRAQKRKTDLIIHERKSLKYIKSLKSLKALGLKKK